MSGCPSCGGAIVRLPSSRLDQLIGSLTDLRPHACEQCLWVGRRRPAAEARRVSHRGPVTLGGDAPTPHRRQHERISNCPICSQGTICLRQTQWIDRVLARLTGRVPLICAYCFWTGWRRPVEGLPLMGEESAA